MHCIKPCMTSKKEVRCSQTVKTIKIEKIQRFNASLHADFDCIRSGVENAAQAAFPAALAVGPPPASNAEPVNAQTVA